MVVLFDVVPVDMVELVVVEVVVAVECVLSPTNANISPRTIVLVDGNPVDAVELVVVENVVVFECVRVVVLGSLVFVDSVELVVTEAAAAVDSAGISAVLVFNIAAVDSVGLELVVRATLVSGEVVEDVSVLVLDAVLGVVHEWHNTGHAFRSSNANSCLTTLWQSDTLHNKHGGGSGLPSQYADVEVLEEVLVVGRVVVGQLSHNPLQ